MSKNKVNPCMWPDEAWDRIRKVEAKAQHYKKQRDTLLSVIRDVSPSLYVLIKKEYEA